MTESFAVLTPSYRGDFERCRLLCASIDAHVSNLSAHYLLVEDRDVAAFRPLAGPRRRIIAESEIFPRWLRSLPDPLSLGRRRVWTSPGAIARGVAPLRGWHTQQLRKIAAPLVVEESVLLFADSDVVFLKPYDLADQVSPQGVRLYRRAGGITATMAEHVDWLIRAADALGLPAPARPADDYINNLITWRTDVARRMIDHVEAASGRHWIETVASARGFSEWLLYGLFADRVLGAASGHAATGDALALTYWFGGDVRAMPLSAGAIPLAGHQVAIGVQSFIGVPVERLWEVFKASLRQRQPLGT